jgi:hypothetical protein
MSDTLIFQKLPNSAATQFHSKETACTKSLYSHGIFGHLSIKEGSFLLGYADHVLCVK